MVNFTGIILIGLAQVGSLYLLPLIDVLETKRVNFNLVILCSLSVTEMEKKAVFLYNYRSLFLRFLK